MLTKIIIGNNFLSKPVVVVI